MNTMHAEPTEALYPPPVRARHLRVVEPTVSLQVRPMPNGKIVVTGGSAARPVDLVFTLRPDGSVQTKGFTSAFPTDLVSRYDSSETITIAGSHRRQVEVRVPRIPAGPRGLKPLYGLLPLEVVAMVRATLQYLMMEPA
ncbi:MAG: hypothetical protein ACYCW6_21870 [Candidatus Xenobia bacterium]